MLVESIGASERKQAATGLKKVRRCVAVLIQI